MGEDPSLARNDGRVARCAEIDAAITAWTQTQTLEVALDALTTGEIPSGRIYTVQDIANDPHYAARGVIEQVTSAQGLTVAMPGILPKLSATPGAIRHRAPVLGEHTDDVLRKLGFTATEVAGLRERGAIG